MSHAWITAETTPPKKPGIRYLFKWGKLKTTPFSFIFRFIKEAEVEDRKPTKKPAIKGAQGLNVLSAELL